MKATRLRKDAIQRRVEALARARNVGHSADEAVDLAIDKHKSDLSLDQKHAYVEYARAFVDLAREVRIDAREIEAEAEALR